MSHSDFLLLNRLFIHVFSRNLHPEVTLFPQQLLKNPNLEPSISQRLSQFERPDIALLTWNFTLDEPKLLKPLKQLGLKPAHDHATCVTLGTEPTHYLLEELSLDVLGPRGVQYTHPPGDLVG